MFRSGDFALFSMAIHVQFPSKEKIFFQFFCARKHGENDFLQGEKLVRTLVRTRKYIKRISMYPLSTSSSDPRRNRS